MGFRSGMNTMDRGEVIEGILTLWMSRWQKSILFPWAQTLRERLEDSGGVPGGGSSIYGANFRAEGGRARGR